MTCGGFHSALGRFSFLILRNVLNEHWEPLAVDVLIREVLINAKYPSKLGATMFNSSSLLQITKEEGPSWRTVESIGRGNRPGTS